MKRSHKLIVAGVLLVSAIAVAGAAIGATKVFSPKQESQAIIDDAAGQLGVTPQRLSNALKQALKNQVDEAVKDGRLTKNEGARMKERIDAGEVPLFGLGPGPEFRDHVVGPFHTKFDAAADYLGMTEAQLREALQSGKTLAEVAKEHNKSVDGLVDALLAGAEQKLQAAVDAGEMTKAEKKEMLAGLRERITDLVNGRLPEPPNGDVPLFGLGPGPEFRDRVVGPFLTKFAAAADYLGMTEAELREALQSGKTLAQVAKEHNKSVDGLVDALLAGAEQKLQAAVDAGEMTKAEKKEMLAGLRERITDLVNGRLPEPPNGDVPLFGLGPGPEFRDRVVGPFLTKFAAAADYLGMTEAELREALQSGKTLAQVAKEHNKSVDGLVDALLAGAEQKLQAAVDAGEMTKAEKKEMLAGLRERITDLVNGRLPEPPNGDVPLFGLGPGPEFRDHVVGPFHTKFDAAADYLGMTEAHLREALQRGKTLAEVAKEHNKSVDGLVDALLAGAEQKLQAAVDASQMTEAEKKDMLAGLRERITDLVNGRLPAPPNGDVPLFGLGPGPEFRDHVVGPFHTKFDAAADYLGMTEAQLREALQSGKTLAQVAKEHNKSVDGLVDALLARAEQKLQAAVDASQ